MVLGVHAVCKEGKAQDLSDRGLIPLRILGLGENERLCCINEVTRSGAYGAT